MPSLSEPVAISSLSFTEPNPTHIGKHLLRLFRRVGELERRLGELERGRRGRRSSKAADPKAAAGPDPFAAREKALARRKAEREREAMRIEKVEMVAGGGSSVGIDSFANARRILSGD